MTTKLCLLLRLRLLPLLLHLLPLRLPLLFLITAARELCSSMLRIPTPSSALQRTAVRSEHRAHHDWLRRRDGSVRVAHLRPCDGATLGDHLGLGACGLNGESPRSWAALEEPPAAAPPGASELPRVRMLGVCGRALSLQAAGPRGAAGSEARHHFQPAVAPKRAGFQMTRSASLPTSIVPTTCAMP